MKSVLKKILPKSISDKISISLLTKGMHKSLEISKAHSNPWKAGEAVDFLFSEDMELFRPWQYDDELKGLAELIEKKNPKVVLEIGTANGGTLFLSSLLATDDAVLISVDLPEGLYGGGYPKWKIPVYQAIPRKQQSVHLLREDSHAKETFEKVKTILGNRKIDYMFIDGDHTYEGVKSDFDMYSQLVSEGGLIAFHDIVSDKNEVPDHFVSVLWDEIKGNYEHHEFVRSREQSKLGLGALYMKHA